jgi:hypothetical protein
LSVFSHFCKALFISEHAQHVHETTKYFKREDNKGRLCRKKNRIAVSFLIIVEFHGAVSLADATVKEWPSHPRRKCDPIENRRAGRQTTGDGDDDDDDDDEGSGGGGGGSRFSNRAVERVLRAGCHRRDWEGPELAVTAKAQRRTERSRHAQPGR